MAKLSVNYDRLEAGVLLSRRPSGDRLASGDGALAYSGAPIQSTNRSATLKQPKVQPDQTPTLLFDDFADVILLAGMEDCAQ